MRAAVALSGLAALLLAPSGARADTEAELRVLLEQHGKLSFDRDDDRVAAAVDTLVAARRRLGVRDVPIASTLLIHQAKLALADGRPGRAALLADAAVELSPDLPAAHVARFTVLAQQPELPIGALLAVPVELAFASLRRPGNAIPLAADAALALGLALLLAAFTWAVVQVIKYDRFIAHDLTRLVPSLTNVESRVAVSLLFIAPFAVKIGIVAPIAIALAVVVAYQTARERRTSFAALILLAMGPIFVYAVAPLFLFPDSSASRLERAAHEALPLDAELSAEAPPLLRAERARLGGRLPEAAAAYREAIAAGSTDPAAHNNLAVVLVQLGEWAPAAEALRAAAADRTIAEPWLNLASVFRRTHNEWQNLPPEAARIDPELAAFFGDPDTLPAPERLLAAPPRRPGALLLLAEIDRKQQRDAALAAWGTIGGALGSWPSTAFVFACTLLGLFLTRRSAALRRSRPCVRCGVPTAGAGERTQCLECASVYDVGIAVDRKLRRERDEIVRSHRRRERRTRLLLAVLPGAAHLHAGRAARGMVMVTLFGLVLLGLARPEGFLPDESFVWIDTTADTLQIVLLGNALAVLSLISWRALAR